ncbi:MAG: DUF58 domain-containing protein, partial [Candidatus Electrothrix sp. AR3]|nr:DUF58 domain-containing protein [Candidatus Electrothrix sp. AR3]
MHYFFYRAYSFFYALSDWRKRRFTSAGLLVLVIIACSAGLGLDTRQSTIYQVFTFTLPLMVLALIFSLFFRARFTVHRKLPKFAMVGEALNYSLVIHNQTGKQQKGLLIQENLADPRPSLEEFSRAREPGEAQRNAWDRKVVYHRWVWLLAKKQRARVKEQPLPPLAPHGKEQVKVELLPLRRGYLELPEIFISRPDPLGLVKSSYRVASYQRVLILPKRYLLP